MSPNTISVEKVTADYTQADLSQAQVAMLDYVVKLTRDPSAIRAGDVDQLRRSKFSDRAIHDIAAITAYYNFVNRIATGLGVELEAASKQIGTQRD